MNEPLVAIIILNWNGWQDTITCLRSLRNITYKNYHIILIDNGSTDDSVKNLTPHLDSNVFFFPNAKNIGFAKGCNQGMYYAIEEMGAEWILLLNNDTEVDPNFLTEMMMSRWNGVRDTVRRLTRKDWVGMIQPLMLRMGNPNIIDSSGHIISWGQVYDRSVGLPRQKEYSMGLIGCSGAAGLYRVEMLKEIGLFDESYDSGYEDSELSWRAYKAGWRTTYDPDAIVYHKRGTSMGKRIDEKGFNENLLKNSVRPCKKHGTVIQKIQFCIHSLFTTTVGVQIVGEMLK